MQHMAAKGWVCVAINYRLSPRDPFPAHVIDVKRAIAWIREHIAEYGGNPDYIAITGGSAGGHLAALAALTPTTRRTSRASRTPTPPSRRRPALRRLRLRRLDRPAQRRAAPRRVPGPADPAEDLGRRARRLRGGLARSCGSPRTRPTSSCCTASTTRWSPSTRPGCSWPRCARSRAHRRVRRASRRPARVRRLPLDPVRPRRTRDRPLPALALEHLAHIRPEPAAGGSREPADRCAILGTCPSRWPSVPAAPTPPTTRPARRRRVRRRPTTAHHSPTSRSRPRRRSPVPRPSRPSLDEAIASGGVWMPTAEPALMDDLQQAWTCAATCPRWSGAI